MQRDRRHIEAELLGEPRGERLVLRHVFVPVVWELEDVRGRRVREGHVELPAVDEHRQLVVSARQRKARGRPTHQQRHLALAVLLDVRVLSGAQHARAAHSQRARKQPLSSRPMP